jgi:NADPH-dependent curcumin reductase CurA
LAHSASFESLDKDAPSKAGTKHLENAPATLRRLFEGRNEGKQLLRVAE